MIYASAIDRAVGALRQKQWAAILVNTLLICAAVILHHWTLRLVLYFE